MKTSVEWNVELYSLKFDEGLLHKCHLRQGKSDIYVYERVLGFKVPSLMDHFQRNFIGDFKGVDTFIYVAPADRVVSIYYSALISLFFIVTVGLSTCLLLSALDFFFSSLIRLMPLGIWQVSLLLRIVKRWWEHLTWLLWLTVMGWQVESIKRLFPICYCRQMLLSLIQTITDKLKLLFFFSIVSFHLKRGASTTFDGRYIIIY